MPSSRAPILLLGALSLLQDLALATAFEFEFGPHPWTSRARGIRASSERYSSRALPDSVDSNPTDGMSAVELIRWWGYPAESYNLLTEDGFNLTVHRIPRGRENGPSDTQSRPIVLLQHGLLQASDQWLLRGPDQDLAFMLADIGYDVWLGNFRGNTYCRAHRAFRAEEDRFWDFSWHENGYYDLAAMIDGILQHSGQSSLLYIGHSMGTTSLLVLLSSRPEYNYRVRAAFLLAPIVYFGRPRGLAGLALSLARQLEVELRPVHAEVLPRTGLPRAITSNFCRAGTPTQRLCAQFYLQVAGNDPLEFNSTLFSTIMSHLPSGSSLGQYVHYAQIYKSGRFQRFDHGPRENVRRYGQAQPPRYNLRNIQAPILLFYSSGDYLAHPTDVERLAAELPRVEEMYKVPWKDFNHGDYMWAIHTYELLYKPLMKLMAKF